VVVKIQDVKCGGGLPNSLVPGAKRIYVVGRVRGVADTPSAAKIHNGGTDTGRDNCGVHLAKLVPGR